MAEVKWIKLDVNLFDNRKIRMIESMPDGDAIVCIWLKILCLAGNTNDCGDVYFTPEIPYTDQMLSAQFNRPISTVQMALSVFEQFGMIDIIDNIIHVSNWERYQNVDGLEKVREQTRQRVAKYREQKKLCNVTSNATVTQGNATDIDKELDIDKIKNKNIDIKHKHGEYDNVLLTDQEYEKLKQEIPGVEDLINRLSEYIASKGAKYKSHYATIKAWYRRDKDKAPAEKPAASYDIEEFTPAGYKKPVYKGDAE